MSENIVSIHQAPPPRPEPAIDALWSRLDMGERDRFVRDNLLELWDAIERVTMPEC
jgi:hypothetical protein